MESIFIIWSTWNREIILSKGSSNRSRLYILQVFCSQIYKTQLERTLTLEVSLTKVALCTSSKRVKPVMRDNDVFDVILQFPR